MQEHVWNMAPIETDCDCEFQGPFPKIYNPQSKSCGNMSYPYHKNYSYHIICEKMMTPIRSKFCTSQPRQPSCGTLLTINTVAEFIDIESGVHYVVCKGASLTYIECVVCLTTVRPLYNKYQNLNVSNLVTQLSLLNPLKPGAKSRMKM